MSRDAKQTLLLLVAIVVMGGLAYSGLAYDFGFWLGTLTR